MAQFNTMSNHGNYYQMAIIDVKTKYVWDYYLETKDQVFEKIQEWLEREIKLLWGREYYLATWERPSQPR